jgi:adenylate cyclase
MRTSRRRQLRAMLVLVVAAALTALALILSFVDPLGKLEDDTIDARFAIRGTRAPPANVMLVRIDDDSFAEIDERWPFRRSLHARVIDYLRRAGARVIAYDVQFTERSGDTPEDDREDNALIRAVGRAGSRVVLPTTVVNRRGEHTVLGGAATLRTLGHGARVGNAFLLLDSDGVYRRFPLAINNMSSFPVVAVEVAERRSITSRGFIAGSRWIDYHGPPGAIPGVSFSDVLHKRVDPELFRDKIVVVGASAPKLQDLHPTSASAQHPMSGAEIHANVISTLLRGEPLRESPAWLDAALVAVLGMLAPLLSLRFKSPRGLLLGMALGLLYAVIVQLAFQAGLILPLVYPAIAIVASWIGVLIIEYATATFERERVREQVARYVPEHIINDVVAATDDDFTLGGKRLQATSVFCDLRAFTAFAELRPVEGVRDVLNQYLGEMSHEILRHGGTIIRYSGDGIFAAFGAPIEQTDHADRALAAVREIAGPCLDRFNAWLAGAHAGERFRIGVGVNSGVVMSCDVGCDVRRDYTVLGAPVNTASRLEAMTKDTPYQVLISDTTIKMMQHRDTTELHYLDAIQLRGMKVKENLWTLASEVSSPPSDEESRAPASASGPPR